MGVCKASVKDVTAIAAGVGALLEDIGGTAAGRPQMEAAARAVIADADAGCVLVGQAGDLIVGVLAASWQTLIHAGERYGVIQDLWVAPAWRREGLGGKLLSALVDRARELGVTRIEVGLPLPSLSGVTRTEAFYLRSGFRSVGLRFERKLR